MAPIARTVPVRGSKRTVTCAVLAPNVDFVWGGSSVTTTNGSSA